MDVFARLISRSYSEQNPYEIEQANANLDGERCEGTAAFQKKKSGKREGNDSDSGCDSFLTTG
jgi:hypothetical protein